VFDKHDLSAIAGYEVRDERGSFSSPGYLYGYDKETERIGTVDVVTAYPLYYGYSLSRIDSHPARTSSIDRNISFYTNMGYVYDKRYALSLSFRKDESNIFGVSSNQRGVPLWSTGLSWNLQNEKF